VLDDVLRVPADAGEKPGRHRVQKEQPDEVQPGLAGDDPPLVNLVGPGYPVWVMRLAA